MKTLVVYSSRTGNTQRLAEAVCRALPDGALLSQVDAAPDPSDYDFVALGFWLQAGQPDPQSQAYLARLIGHPKVFLFATHGASPQSEHARQAMAQARTMTRGAQIAGTFSCYGSVNPTVLETAKAKPQPPAWLADAPNAVGHPDADDMDNLRRALAAAV